MIRERLRNYIYNEVIPKYAAFDKAHREDHAITVIERALSIGMQYDINEEMLLGSRLHRPAVLQCFGMAVLDTLCTLWVQ